MRELQFQNQKIYHVFNRGTDKRKVFNSRQDFNRFLLGLRLLNRPEIIGNLHRRGNNVDTKCQQAPLIELIAYCLLPNHYHLLLRQLADWGVSRFMHKVGMAYAKYFNEKNNRSGVLFQGPFKAVGIESDEQLLYTAAYVNCNAEIHGIDGAESWSWSSQSFYLGLNNNSLASAVIVLKDFKSINAYLEYTKEVVKNARSLKDAVE